MDFGQTVNMDGVELDDPGKTEYPNNELTAGLLSSFLSKNLKTTQLVVNTDEKTLRPVARLKEPRDLFALPKDRDNDCSQQAPRWPIECQVLEERVSHIPYVPTIPEPLNQPTGNELKPRPVGEENGIVIFNYNPISAVNYNNSSDSDSDSSDSRASTPECPEPQKKKSKNLSISEIISEMVDDAEGSSSNSNDEDEDEYDCEIFNKIFKGQIDEILDLHDGSRKDYDYNSYEEPEHYNKGLNGECEKETFIEAEEKDIQSEVEDDFSDIWKDKSPEYEFKSYIVKDLDVINSYENTDCVNEGTSYEYNSFEGKVEENFVEEEELTNVWRDKSPEYLATTPTYLKKQLNARERPLLGFSSWIARVFGQPDQNSSDSETEIDIVDYHLPKRDPIESLLQSISSSSDEDEKKTEAKEKVQASKLNKEGTNEGNRSEPPKPKRRIIKKPLIKQPSAKQANRIENNDLLWENPSSDTNTEDSGLSHLQAHRPITLSSSQLARLEEVARKSLIECKKSEENFKNEQDSKNAERSSSSSSSSSSSLSSESESSDSSDGGNEVDLSSSDENDDNKNTDPNSSNSDLSKVKTVALPTSNSNISVRSSHNINYLLLPPRTAGGKSIAESSDPSFISNKKITDLNENSFNDNPNLKQFSRSAVGGSKFLSNCHPADPASTDGLEFESRFESGNLAKAVQITRTYYELYLRPDLYTSRSKQWFYFRVKNTKKNLVYRLSIVNLIKSDSLFNEGMRPVMYSTIDAKEKKIGWKRCGDNIAYYRNDEETGEEEDENSLYTLTFNIEFSNDGDTVYFAHCYPYTYSDLQDYLMNIQNDPVKSQFCKLRLLCRTLAGNNVYYLTVTAPSINEETIRKKKAVVVSARVHPSETPASWMMKGLMDFLTGDSTVAKRLRHRFIFKLIPMLNPDGVIVGNTRNSLAGKDLNRQYRTVIRETYPSIWYTKALIKRLIDECGVAMYCDMHAHSRKHNIFIYGCENRRNPEKRLTEQVFPLMLHKNVADKFSFESCKFKIQRSKEGTGRIVVWMLGITNSYTIEASFGGSLLGSRKGTHFNIAERLRLKIIERLLKEGSSADEPLNIPLSDYSSDEGNCSSSSDNEGKGSITVSDLEGPCCGPLKAPPCSPDADFEARKFRYKRMKKIMQQLDKVYFQPVLHKKFQTLFKGNTLKQKSYFITRNKKKKKVVKDIEDVIDPNQVQTNVTKISDPKAKISARAVQNETNNPKQVSQQLSQSPQNIHNKGQNQILMKNSSSLNSCTKKLSVINQKGVETMSITSTIDTSSQSNEVSRDPKESLKKPRLKRKKRFRISRLFRLWLLKRNIVIYRKNKDSCLLTVTVETAGSVIKIGELTLSTRQLYSIEELKLMKLTGFNDSFISTNIIQTWIKKSMRKSLFSTNCKLPVQTAIIVKQRRRKNFRRKKGLGKNQKDRLPLDMPTTDPGSDLHFSTDDEFQFNKPRVVNKPPSMSNVRRSIVHHNDLMKRMDVNYYTKMNPELIITSPTRQKHTYAVKAPNTAPATAPNATPNIAPNTLNMPPFFNNGILPKFQTELYNQLPKKTSSWQDICSSSTKINRLRAVKNADDIAKMNLRKKIISTNNEVTGSYNTSNPESFKGYPSRLTTTKEMKLASKTLNKIDINASLLNECSQKLLLWQQWEKLKEQNQKPEKKNPGSKGDSKVKTRCKLVPPGNSRTNAAECLKRFLHNKSEAYVKKKHSMQHQESAQQNFQQQLTPQQQSQQEMLSKSESTKSKKQLNLSKVAETTQFLHKVAKSKICKSGLTVFATKSNTSLQSIGGGVSGVVGGTNLHSQKYRGSNKFKTGGIVVTAVQPSEKKPKKCKTLNLVNGGIQVSNANNNTTLNQNASNASIDVKEKAEAFLTSQDLSNIQLDESKQILKTFKTKVKKKKLTKPKIIDLSEITREPGSIQNNIRKTKNILSGPEFQQQPTVKNTSPNANVFLNVLQDNS